MGRIQVNLVDCLLLVGLSIILNGCVSGNSQTSTIMSSQSSRPTISLQTSGTSTLTKFPAVTVTFTPTTLPIPTTMPTLTINSARKLINSLSANNGNCLFPCLWGFTPGISNINEFKNYFSQFSNIKSGSSYTNFRWFEDVGGISFGYLIKDGEISGILAHRGTTSIDYLTLYLSGYKNKPEEEDNILEQEFNYYFMHQILKVFGPPEQVIVGPSPEDPDRPNGWEPFNVVLYYPDNGFAVEYIMTKQSFGEYFVGCPKQVREINITTWNVKESKTLEDIAQNNPAFWGMSPGNLAVYYKTIEEALSQTPENFYEIYKNPNSNCIKAPMELWPYR